MLGCRCRPACYPLGHVPKVRPVAPGVEFYTPRGMGWLLRLKLLLASRWYAREVAKLVDELHDVLFGDVDEGVFLFIPASLCDDQILVFVPVNSGRRLIC